MIGSVNLANMLLARAARRDRESRIRAALGAGRMRVVVPVLLESLVTSVVGAALALVVTRLSFDALLRQVPPMAYGAAPVGVGSRVALITLALGLGGGVAFSVVPVWRAMRVDASALLRGRHRVQAKGTPRFGRPMTVVQVALTVVLVSAAMMAGRALVAILRTPLEFLPDRVVVVRLAAPRAATTGLGRQEFYARTVELVGRHPDVVSTGASGSLPLDGTAMDDSMETPGARVVGAGLVHVLPGYFETPGIRLLRGRLPTWDDVRADAEVAVVAERTGRILADGADPLNRLLIKGRGRHVTVVGVVADLVRTFGRDTGSPAYVIPGPDTNR